MMTDTLPAPTPKAGCPLEYAARILDCEPVATIRSAPDISAWVASFETGLGNNCTRSRGALSLSSSAWTYSSILAEVAQPRGEGARMIAFRHLRALTILLTGVAAGFVDGTIEAITPAGRAISVIPVSG